MSRAERYARAIQKVWYAEKPTPQEARELKRHRLEDGSYPLPGTAA